MIRSASDVSRLHRQWSRTTIRRTALGSLGRYLSPRPVVDKDIPLCLLTFTIYPDLVRLWHLIWTHVWPRDLPIVIVDSSGELDSECVPGAHVHRFVNKYHGWKADRFIHRWIKSSYVWLTDDDKFVVNMAALDFVRHAMQDGVAAVSFAPRIKGWRFTIDGCTYAAMGSYCVVLNRTVIVGEKLPLSPVPYPNEHKPDVRTGKPGTYDTLDWANEQMIRRGYKVIVRGDNDWCVGFDGTSSARILATVLRPDTLRQTLLRPRFEPGTYTRWWAAMAYGLYAVAKVASLYYEAFHQEPQLPAPLAGEEIKNSVADAAGVPDDTRYLALTQMSNYDQVANQLLALIKAGG